MKKCKRLLAVLLAAVLALVVLTGCFGNESEVSKVVNTVNSVRRTNDLATMLESDALDTVAESALQAYISLITNGATESEIKNTMDSKVFKVFYDSDYGKYIQGQCWHVFYMGVSDYQNGLYRDIIETGYEATYKSIRYVGAAVRMEGERVYVSIVGGFED